MTTSDSREGGAPPNTKTKRRSRILSGPARSALQDLYLILLILSSDLEPGAGNTLRMNLNRWLEMYIGKL